MTFSEQINEQENLIWRIHELAVRENAIDMSIGNPDLSIPERLITLAGKYVKTGSNNFSPPFGLLQLKEQISRLVHDRNQQVFDPSDEITITAGTIQAIATAITAFLREGDEVLVFEPSNHNFSATVEQNGGKMVYVPLKTPGFQFDWEEIRKMISSKTKIILFNSPHYPTGRVFAESDLLQLQKLVNGTNIIVISDELFENLVFDNLRHQSISLFKRLIPRSLIISSFGPVLNINGWAIAWILGPGNLMKEFRRIHQFQLYNVNSPLQYALADYLKEIDSFDETVEYYQGKRNYFLRLMKGTDFRFIPAQGSYFQLLDFSGISDESDISFSFRLLNDFRLATIPVSEFYHKKINTGFIRVCFAKNNETLEKAAEIFSIVGKSR